jgi:hypothetical protein
MSEGGNHTMKPFNKSSGGLVLVLSMFLLFISCQAGQPKSQKQSTAKETSATSTQTALNKSDTTKEPVTVNDKIIVYYFHNDIRCPTCYKLESYAKAEVESAFAGAIGKGKLEWKTVNVDEPGNGHFVEDYTLYTKSVIVSTLKDGKELSWKNLDKIWQLVRDEGGYREYIRNEVKACLEGKCL